VQLERAMTQLVSRFGGMGFAELQEVDPREFRAFAVEFGDVVRTLPFQLPENFLLIVRAMSLTSGMCSALDPAFNIWDAVEPYAQRLIREESGNTAQALVREVGSVAAVTARLPRRIDTLVSRFEEGAVSVETPRIERRLRDLERMIRRVLSAVLFTGLLIGGILLQSEQAVWGTLLMIASIAPLSHALLAGAIARRNGG
jgi:predicted unusual protein kinase regulating ubiquinone biosynthesis (AarF/ABC1/UbiB family)